jgi:glycosyltransferase involved in cell wall biosynthesis
MKPIISVCIPAYNRPELLTPLLYSIVNQDYNSYNIVICEDDSPKRSEIRKVTSQYIDQYPGLIQYYENESNLGFDGNVRRLFEKADGDFCLFMGNDDLMCPGALSIVAGALDRYPNVGVVMRSYASFEGSPDNIKQIHRYFPTERFFPAGPETIVTFYRRLVVLPGIAIHRQAALKFATDRFDGTALYQVYLVANILAEKNGLFLPEIIALNRHGGIPDLGNSPKEKGRFVPAQQTPDSSVYFVAGMLEIAQYVEANRNIKIYEKILKDIGNYSYPILAIQAKRSLSVFLCYTYQLAQLGFWKNAKFYLYLLSLLLLGPERMDHMISRIKNQLGFTPIFGRISIGRPIN